MTEHKVIWLQPWCENCAMHEDRNWCEDDVWPDGCEECGTKSPKYTLSTLPRPHQPAPEKSND